MSVGAFYSASRIHRENVCMSPQLLHCNLSSEYQLESNHLMTAEQFRQVFYSEYFDYSLLLNTGTGYFAFCIKLD